MALASPTKLRNPNIFPSFVRPRLTLKLSKVVVEAIQGSWVATRAACDPDRLPALRSSLVSLVSADHLDLSQRKPPSAGVKVRGTQNHAMQLQGFNGVQMK